MIPFVPHATTLSWNLVVSIFNSLLTICTRLDTQSFYFMFTRKIRLFVYDVGWLPYAKTTQPSPPLTWLIIDVSMRN